MITINPQAADVITIQLSDADQIALNTTAILLEDRDADTLQGEDGAYYLDRANHTGTQAANTITGLATVATSGSYNDLSNKPTISTDAETLDGQDGAYYLSRANHTGTQAISTVTGLQTALDDKLESVAWGDITGTLSDQTDLQAALDTLTDTDIDLQDALNLKLNIADYNDRFLGLFSSVFGLVAAHPTASAGDYAQVDFGIGMDVIVYAWDVSDAQWSAVGSSSIASTDALPEGSSNLYHTGQRVRDTSLTGLSTATATPITAADSVLSAAGKLQAQISASSGGGSTLRKFPAGFWATQHQLPPTSTVTQTNTLIVYMFFLLPHAITINRVGYAFGSSQSPSQVISARFYDFATGAAATPQINLTGGGWANSGAITPQTLQAGAYVVAVKPSQVADFFTITSTSCPLFPTTNLRGTATAKQTVLAGAALPATFPSSGLTYDNSNHPAVNFFVSA